MSKAWSGLPAQPGWRHAVHFAVACPGPAPLASMRKRSRLEASRSRSSNAVLSRSCGRTNSKRRNERRLATLRSRVRSKAGFISTITPSGLQRATGTGACSKMARKVVLVFSSAESSGHGNGVAVFILLLSRGTIPGRKPAAAVRYLSAPEMGALNANWQSNLLVRPHYRRGDLRLRRAHVTQIGKGLWKTMDVACFLLDRGINKDVENPGSEAE